MTFSISRGHTRSSSCAWNESMPAIAIGAAIATAPVPTRSERRRAAGGHGGGGAGSRGWWRSNKLGCESMDLALSMASAIASLCSDQAELRMGRNLVVGKRSELGHHQVRPDPSSAKIWSKRSLKRRHPQCHDAVVSFIAVKCKYIDIDTDVDIQEQYRSLLLSNMSAATQAERTCWFLVRRVRVTVTVAPPLLPVPVAK